MSYQPKTVWVTRLPWTAEEMKRDLTKPKTVDEKVREYLRNNPWHYISDISKSTQMPITAVTRCIKKMEESKEVLSRPGNQRTSKLWSLKP